MAWAAGRCCLWPSTCSQALCKHLSHHHLRRTYAANNAPPRQVMDAYGPWTQNVSEESIKVSKRLKLRAWQFGCGERQVHGPCGAPPHERPVALMLHFNATCRSFPSFAPARRRVSELTAQVLGRRQPRLRPQQSPIPFLTDVPFHSLQAMTGCTGTRIRRSRWGWEQMHRDGSLTSSPARTYPSGRSSGWPVHQWQVRSPRAPAAEPRV